MAVHRAKDRRVGVRNTSTTGGELLFKSKANPPGLAFCLCDGPDAAGRPVGQCALYTRWDCEDQEPWLAEQLRWEPETIAWVACRMRGSFGEAIAQFRNAGCGWCDPMQARFRACPLRGRLSRLLQFTFANRRIAADSRWPRILSENPHVFASVIVFIAPCRAEVAFHGVQEFVSRSGRAHIAGKDLPEGMH